jgi:retron-type reverse transcriptase
MWVERRGHISQSNEQGQHQEEPLSKTRPHNISMAVVEAAYEDVKDNKGAPGVDGQTIEDFDKKAEDNLYKIWNRMASGSYFPKPVKAVEIPKGDGKSVRKLGIPTVSDRVAQTVAFMYLNPLVEPKFHQDSYGFRKGRGQKDALKVTRIRCRRYDWVVDLDIQGFFDNLDHQMLLVPFHRGNDQLTSSKSGRSDGLNRIRMLLGLPGTRLISPFVSSSITIRCTVGGVTLKNL